MRQFTWPKTQSVSKSHKADKPIEMPFGGSPANIYGPTE